MLAYILRGLGSPGMSLTVELVVYVEVAHILERSRTCGAFEAFWMQGLSFNLTEKTPEIVVF